MQEELFVEGKTGEVLESEAGEDEGEGLVDGGGAERDVELTAELAPPPPAAGARLSGLCSLCPQPLLPADQHQDFSARTEITSNSI